MKKLLVAGIAFTGFGVMQSIAADVRRPNVLSKIGSLLGLGGFWLACLGGGCSYFLNGPYTIQIVSWGGFASIVGVYVTLTWAKLWKQSRLGAIPARGTHASAGLSEPLPESALLVVERWLCVIKELQQDSYEPCGSNIEGEKNSCSVREAGKERQNFRSSQGNVIFLMRGQSPNRHRAQSSSPPKGHHGQDRHQHRRARCARPAPSW